MNQRTLGASLVFATLLTSGCLLASTAAIAEEGCVSGQCHVKLLTGSTVHPVAENCESCHESVSTPHPNKGTKTFKLTQDPPDLCYMCHEAFGKKKLVHFPVTGGMCTTCHNPHSSNQPKLLLQDQKELCGSCHADHVNFKVLHGPVSAGSCTACHSPHESDNKTLLLKDGQELCFGCHLDMPDVLKKKNVHPALASGCPTCHNPHGSAFPKMLTGEGEQVCFQCHGDIAEIVTKAPVAHPAVQMGCPSCHSPHASDQEKLLLNDEKETCLGCHTGVVTKNMKVFHGTNNDGKCTRCHNPHGGQYEKLLVKEFPSEAYVPYTDTAFPLCFSCHKRDLLQYPETSFATNFRNGERNLHYVHVNNKEKGRSCKLCHSWHGSVSPQLIADTVPFGQWNLPLRFVKTETGGGCSPGCHKTQYYDRKNPGKKPDLPRPPISN